MTARYITTEEQARFVRKLRVDDGETWRGVADECGKAWGHDWWQQWIGAALCEEAARFLGENPHDEPWN